MHSLIEEAHVMGVTPQSTLQTAQHTPPGSFRETLAVAARFWEPRRIAYNAVLCVIVAAWMATTWPHFRDALSLFHLGQMLVLALLANVCYSAAYLVDLAAQLSALNAVSRKTRWALWIAGTLFAILLANYWIADEIYPDFH